MPTRAAHTKTRNGCLRCKQRRVKCDEGQPCRDCHRRNEFCNLVTDPRYVASFHNGSSASPSSFTAEATSIRQLSTASPVASPRQQDNQFSSFSTVQSAVLSSVPSTEWAEDLHLMAHWTIATCQTLHRQPHVATLFQKTAPELALELPSMMHMMLSLSALHLAYLRPSEHKKYTTISMRHHHSATQQFQGTIQNITKDNFLPIFLTSSLLSVSSLANINVTAHSLSLDDIIAVFIMTRGTRDILTPAHDRLNDPVLYHLLEPLMERNTLNTNEDHEIPYELAERLKLLRTDLLEKHTYDYDSSKETCLHALRELEDVFLTVVHLPTEDGESLGTDYRKRIDLELGVLMKWQTGVSTTYVNLLKQRRVAPLVLLVHWVMLFRHLGKRWFLDGWIETAFRLVRDALEKRDRHWLLWSEEYVKN
ncbi:hypothetical protein EJ08DRAFT_4349 [Tothia fuscella]|uniref:Zn(2)-C6 fungal-type domain-containing protein n=1 Tax=Tothia fuscella TaxID=1048955 RepID=A0A9P4P4Z1_9PEZI|nr:hypothetical protein EJ08DRAFT_4349 [Tothia fuscella]